MRYAIEIRKGEYQTESGQTRGTWESAGVIEADCTADARRMARKRFKGQKWRINRRKSTHSIAETPVAPDLPTPVAEAEAVAAPAPAVKKAKGPGGKSGKGKAKGKK